ncbi:MAG: bifunctional phosphoglucose/phosphomannose isomerase [Dehalococcoidia bacterium]
MPTQRQRLAMLDDPSHRAVCDPTDFWGRIASLPQQVVAATAAAAEVALPLAVRACNRILVAGMGGSAIGGDLLASLAEARGGPQVVVWRDFGLPAWVDQHTLVVVSTYSGETAETLSALHTAIVKGLPTLVITFGGKAAQWAAQHNLPLLVIPYKGEPRTAVGWLFFGMLGLLERAGLFPGVTNWGEMVALLERQAQVLAPQSSISQNTAKVLAESLYGRVPLVWGGGFLKGVAHRWKTQVNENAKTPAFAEAIPEVFHNSVEGFGEMASRLAVVVLSSAFLESEHRRRVEGVVDLLAGRGVWCRRVEGEGESLLAHMASLLYLGDWTSYYLALLYGKDPAPVPTITSLRQRLGA